ncbi:hypothetical protein I546_6976 [Mycobacterium kansasii 732]|uniref:Uncharacterized protein n=1 Tax=Mycobacterium pseudokansasii TaxID=2341080 RepID=A0A498QR72_9MYCO|nr:hypothetical protein I546_6976 [Mycobacterium kansasii 732]VAZ91765.1 hypothetical protein LAUMK35_01734 [Mycobacterium pseudokansasii]VAZ92703.1 hypothetical protein LAUMK21_01733 [Mycobacterium pseudokansasii]VBA48899.1 hypothetical protein LAUMK142_01606 [Mycobacterium pseudokansasii]
MADDNFDDNRDDGCAAQYGSYHPNPGYRAWSRLLPAPGSAGLGFESP